MIDQSKGTQPEVSAADFTGSTSSSYSEAREKAASNPHFIMYNTVGKLANAVKSLEFSCDMAERRLSVLENLPRHDITIDDATWKVVADLRYDPIGIAFDRIQRDLKLCVSNIQQAANSARGVFKAELKVKIEDRIQRHMRETKGMMDELNMLADEHKVPRQPYLIRQATLSAVLVEFPEMLEMSRAFRDTLDPNGIHSQARAALIEQEAVVLRVRSPLAKWRDNPSQKMGTKLQTARQQLLGVVGELEKISAAALYECKLAGVVLYNRCGRWNYLPHVQLLPAIQPNSLGES